jgi:hypothetical protein
MVYGEHTTTNGRYNLVVDVHDSFLVKLWWNGIYHCPVGLVNSNIVWENETKRIRNSPGEFSRWLC